MKKGKQLGHCEIMRWKEQTLAESLAWHAATGSLTAQNKTAYMAGYQEGYMAALSALKLHGALEIDKDR